jgi:ribonucleoside-diphosphate reductase alpha chain
MRITRRLTTEGQDPYDSVSFRSATSEIKNPDGSLVFRAERIEVPAEWSQVAADILASAVTERPSPSKVKDDNRPQGFRRQRFSLYKIGR